MQQMNLFERVAILAVATVLGGVSPSALAADFAGWQLQQQMLAKPGAREALALDCTEARKASDSAASAEALYRLADCELSSPEGTLEQAAIWLERSAELEYTPALILLRRIQRAQLAAHSSIRHCHDLGQGLQLCHGGPPRSALPRDMQPAMN